MLNAVVINRSGRELFRGPDRGAALAWIQAQGDLVLESSSFLVGEGWRFYVRSAFA